MKIFVLHLHYNPREAEDVNTYIENGGEICSVTPVSTPKGGMVVVVAKSREEVQTMTTKTNDSEYLSEGAQDVLSNCCSIPTSSGSDAVIGTSVSSQHIPFSQIYSTAKPPVPVVELETLHLEPNRNYVHCGINTRQELAVATNGAGNLIVRILQRQFRINPDVELRIKDLSPNKQFVDLPLEEGRQLIIRTNEHGRIIVSVVRQEEQSSPQNT